MRKTDKLENVAFVINFNVTYITGSEISMPRLAYANLQPLARPYKESEIFQFFRQN